MIHGTTSDGSMNIKEAVYKVKANDGTDDYTRIHFETSSHMVYDATSKAEAEKVVRRDEKGAASFKEVSVENANIRYNEMKQSLDFVFM